MSDLSNPPAVTPPRTPWFKTPKGMKTLIGSAAGIVVVVVAIVLVVTLVVTPNQRAAQAAASASAQAAQDYQDAVTAFNSAADACTSANQQLSAAITSAQSTAKTDPSTMQDPTLIDKLNQAITTAQAVKTCAAPTMASDTATIQQQTTQLGTDTQAVTTAASTLTAAGQAVPASVLAKKDAETSAAEAAAAAIGKGSADVRTDDGYTYHVEWSGFSVDSAIDSSLGAPGTVQMSTTLVPGTVTLTNTTPGKTAPQQQLYLFPVYSPNASALWSAWGSPVNWSTGTSGEVAMLPDIVATGIGIARQNSPVIGVGEPTQDGITANGKETTILDLPEAVVLDVPANQSSDIQALTEAPIGWLLATGLNGNLGCTVFAVGYCYVAVSDSLK